MSGLSILTLVPVLYLIAIAMTDVTMGWVVLCEVGGVHMRVDGEPVVVGVDGSGLLLPPACLRRLAFVPHFESMLIIMGAVLN